MMDFQEMGYEFITGEVIKLREVRICTTGNCAQMNTVLNCMFIIIQFMQGVGIA
jgi:hypothetical protein